MPGVPRCSPGPASASGSSGTPRCRMGRLGAAVEPDPARTAYYERVFAIQREVYPSLREVFARLARLDPGEPVGAGRTHFPKPAVSPETSCLRPIA